MAIYDTHQLKKAIEHATKVASTRSPKEIFQMLLVDMDTNTIHASDSENWIEVTIPVDAVIEPGRGQFCIPAITFNGIIGQANLDSVSIFLDGDTVEIKADSARFELPSARAEEFPKMKAIGEDAASFQTHSESFLTGIRSTIYACDITSTRYALGGLYLKCEGDGKAFICGTDGRRLSKQSIAATAVTKPFSANITYRGCKLLLANMPDGEATLYIEHDRVVMQSNGVKLSCVQLEGRYPDIEKVVPDISKAEQIPMERESLLRGLRQAAILIDDESRGIKIECATGGVNFKAKNPTKGRSEIHVPNGHAMTSQPWEITVNCAYLQDACKNIDGPISLYYCGQEGNKPIVIRNDTGFVGVVMPMATD